MSFAAAREIPKKTPRGGSNKASPPGLRPAPRALLGVGHAAPRPPGLHPLCRLRGTGTPLSCRAKERGWGFWFGNWKSPAGWGRLRPPGGIGGGSPLAGRRWATRPRRWTVRGQRFALSPPSTDWARLSTADRTTGQRGRSLEAIGRKALPVLKYRITAGDPVGDHSW
jgi:hypothetical protein